jgi:hypothetical protein
MTAAADDGLLHAAQRRFSQGVFQRAAAANSPGRSRTNQTLEPDIGFTDADIGSGFRRFASRRPGEPFLKRITCANLAVTNDDFDHQYFHVVKGKRIIKP